METFCAILRKHTMKYKKMTPCDAVKLAYQSVYGGGHLITDTAASMARLEQEMESVTSAPDTELIESIGGGMVRLYLQALDPDVLPLTAVNALFCRSARMTKGTLSDFETALHDISCGAREGYLPFTAEEFERYLASYRAAGMKAVHHSKIYNEAYHPAYRIIREEFVPYLSVIGGMYRVLVRKGRVVLSIEGMSGSGKSTLASLLADLCDGEVIHMDDFFLPMEKRTPERLAEPGGNIDYERFCEEVCPGLLSGDPFSYGLFDCSRMEVTQKRVITDAPVRIVEGCYAMHPAFPRYADIALFLHVPPTIQLNRIIRRNGEKIAEKFKNIWIPMENRYFRETHAAERCRYVICGE